MFISSISVKGSYHDKNQDSYKFKELDNGFVIAISDGLGSRSKSEIGSEKACEAAVEIAADLGYKLFEVAPIDYMNNVHKLWLEKLSFFDLNQYLATILIFIIYKNRILSIRLGDGFIGMSFDNEMKILYDRKEGMLSNETYCLAEELDFENMEIYDIRISNLDGVVMCTDGIQINNMEKNELLDFTKEFIENYSKFDEEEVYSDIYSWVSEWPGRDDKTIAYLLKEVK